MSMIETGLDVTVVAEGNLMSCDLAGDTAILHFTNGMYYTLNPVATTVWALIQQPKLVRDVHAALLERYEIDDEPCANDLLSFLRDLSAHGLARFERTRP